MEGYDTSIILKLFKISSLISSYSWFYIIKKINFLYITAAILFLESARKCKKSKSLKSDGTFTE